LEERYTHRTKGDLGNVKKISSTKVLDEYWRSWFETNIEKEKVRLITSHPLLTREDFDRINQKSLDTQIKQVKWGGIATASVSLMLFATLRKNRMVYNYFKKPSKYFVIRMLWLPKVIFPFLALFMGCMASMKGIYQEDMLGFYEKEGFNKRFDYFGHESFKE
jgi:hypothetical protein